MKKIDDMYLDIREFIYTDKVREITILFDGSLLTIHETPIGDSDLWIVLSNSLANFLKDSYNSAYPMFFGCLLTALNKYNSVMPVTGICFGEIHHSLENGGHHFHDLIEEIASGRYKSKKFMPKFDG